jgi:hypothetical protein
MKVYRDYIEKLRSEFVGKRIMYEGKCYTVAMVDYNGIIHIDKPTEHNKTTAVYEPCEARKALI